MHLTDTRLTQAKHKAGLIKPALCILEHHLIVPMKGDHDVTTD